MLSIASKAGFANVKSVDEPSAAIHTVLIQQGGLLQSLNSEKLNVLIVDMGAGTTDLALCRYTARSKSTEILSTWPKTNSGEFFGGREIDNALWDYIKQYLSDCGIQNIYNEVQYLPACKAWKESNVSPALGKNRAQQHCGFIMPLLTLMGEPKSFPSITRSSFENMLDDYLRQFPALVNDLLKNTPDIKPEDIDLVILTGGHSQWYFTGEILSGAMTSAGTVSLPKIKQEPQRIVRLARPHETVALGLVYQGINVAIEKNELLNGDCSTWDDFKFYISASNTLVKFGNNGLTDLDENCKKNHSVFGREIFYHKGFVYYCKLGDKIESALAHNNIFLELYRFNLSLNAKEKFYKSRANVVGFIIHNDSLFVFEEMSAGIYKIGHPEKNSCIETVFHDYAEYMTINRLENNIVEFSAFDVQEIKRSGFKALLPSPYDYKCVNQRNFKINLNTCTLVQSSPY